MQNQSVVFIIGTHLNYFALYYLLELQGSVLLHSFHQDLVASVDVVSGFGASEDYLAG